jgi:hypothetical protein
MKRQLPPANFCSIAHHQLLHNICGICSTQMLRMKPFAFLTLAILLLAVSACKKKEAPPVEIPKPEPTAVGTPDGAPVSKNIGPAGGTLVSSDGRLEIIIPPNAVATATDFSVQPVTNHASNGMGKAYRCLPDSFVFARNINLRFHYDADALNRTRSEFMRIAFQNRQRIWQDVENVSNDTAARHLTIATNHFTDYTIFHLFDLQPAPVYLRHGETKQLKIEIARGINWSDQLSQMIRLITDIQRHPVQWKANGVPNGNTVNGTISNTGFAAAYTAPSTTPPVHPVNVSATIDLPYTLDGVRYNQFILATNVFITGNRYRVVLELERPINVAGSWTMKDKGEYMAIINGQSVTVTGIQNQNAGLQLLQLAPGCASVQVDYYGVGDINIVASDFQAGVRDPNGDVYILFDPSRQNQLPRISFVCGNNPGSVDLGMNPTFPGSAQFKDNGQPQVIDASGPTIVNKVTVTPLQ